MPSRAQLRSVQQFGQWLAIEFPDMSIDDFNKIIDKADELFGWEPARTPAFLDQALNEGTGVYCP